MIVVLDRGIRDTDKSRVRGFLETHGFRVREIVGEEETILGAVGIVTIDRRKIELLPGVARVIPITKPYKLASRELKKSDTVVSILDVKVGGSRFAVTAGPCAVESKDQINETARLVRAAGAAMLRGGAYKPRTSPYSFQGLGEEGLKLLKDAGEREGMPVVSEIVDGALAERMADYVDVFQIGARNMQNFELLKRVGSIGKAVLLKRGLAATIDEWLMAAEYLLAHGTDDIILCERGIRTFETQTRNTLDISSIPVVKQLSHLPIIVDPSHAIGIRDKVPPLGLAAVAAGADGLLLEVHPNPDEAASDGPQSLFPEQFDKLMRDIEVLASVVGKEIFRLPVSGLGSGPPSVTPGSGAKRSVAFQGVSGAFSEGAAQEFFAGRSISMRPSRTFRDVFDSVLTGEASFGVLPIENSLAGSIHENYDLLLQYRDVKIVGEQKIRIVHNLIGTTGSDVSSITRVYSHPQGLAQCATFLDRFPNIERMPHYDTAGAVAHIAESNRPEWAAIASAEAAALYDLPILNAGIETNPLNYTRFFVIARIDGESPEHPTTVSIVFETADKPGALFECLQILSEESLNMHKLESRPIHGKPWEYMFYIDLEIPAEGSRIAHALAKLDSVSDSFRVLGEY